MNLCNLNEQFQQLTTILDEFHPVDWDDIVSLLYQIKKRNEAPLIPYKREDYLKFFARGTAFITFDYGIDGVSIETAKYAQTLNDLFTPFGTPSIHFIGGNFHPQASSILKPEWHTFQIDGIDGWNKWDDGKWFNALFREKMKSFGTESDQLVDEVYKQAVLISKQLGKYFLDNQISLIIPVNVASNPGNIALTLGLVFVTEILGICVLNSNHDFYWEAGKPISERDPEETPGVRDHFFRNIKNRSFFRLFKLLYPWNGKKWLQVNINARQSKKLVKKFSFPKGKVFEISTCIADTFFKTYSKKEVTNIRLRMGHILSDGKAIMHPVPIDKHLAKVDQWMKNQQPVILGSRPGLSIDPKSDDLIVLLQPTRIINRKKITRNLDLINALFRKSALRNEFETNSNRQLILHITGPTPKEHQKDLEKVLFAYRKRICALPEFLADRIFLAFSVGQASHTASFSKKQFEPLTIENIYQMADVVVFPSKTEGRGLPIIEAGASGTPIICSQYRPKSVFRDVIGEKLPQEMQIQYTLFPKGKFSEAFLSKVTDLLIYPDSQQKLVNQNREAVRSRFSNKAFHNNFERLLNQLYDLDQGA
jgi:glycosyltransferase involved in cell wall biosynthesis